LAPSWVAVRDTDNHRLGGASVINMASNVALMGVAGRDCYTAAKGGTAAITRSMAAEFAPQKVRLNAIALAATMTDRGSRFEAGNPRGRKSRRHI
jgi:NAD(P)-dependent dehydrogenase (short-subunit alcohol dehydrogenase family)